jgi:acyl-CoA-dependent ceramide synthase
MWADFPITMIEGKFKYYYIVQFACWLHQLFIVNIEERRKDHWQMFTHHIFTSALLLTSYGCYMMRVGNVFLCIMDVVDILLPVSNTLSYATIANIFSSPKCSTTFSYEPLAMLPLASSW